MGAVCNTSAVLLSVVSMFFVFSWCRDPAELVFNALAVAFLYSVDDVAGDLNVLTDKDWHGELLGRLQMLNSPENLEKHKEAAESPEGAEGRGTYMKIKCKIK